MSESKGFSVKVKGACPVCDGCTKKVVEVMKKYGGRVDGAKNLVQDGFWTFKVPDNVDKEKLTERLKKKLGKKACKVEFTPLGENKEQKKEDKKPESNNHNEQRDGSSSSNNGGGQGVNTSQQGGGPKPESNNNLQKTDGSSSSNNGGGQGGNSLQQGEGQMVLHPQAPMYHPYGRPDGMYYSWPISDENPNACTIT